MHWCQRAQGKDSLRPPCHAAMSCWQATAFPTHTAILSVFREPEDSVEKRYGSRPSFFSYPENFDFFFLLYQLFHLGFYVFVFVLVFEIIITVFQSSPSSVQTLSYNAPFPLSNPWPLLLLLFNCCCMPICI